MATLTRFIAVAAATLFPFGALQAQQSATEAGYTAAQCPSCAAWNEPNTPAHLFGNAYYVGTHGLSAVLLTSSAGHILVDAGLPESAAPIMANIRALGFKVEDIRLIVNSHAHYDHAGGIAAIQRASSARVAATPWSAKVIAAGKARPEDPQYAIALPYPAMTGTPIREIADGDTLQVGTTTITAHYTGGHTPGGTSWSWRSCEGAQCRDVVYADSQTPVSADDFYFTRTTAYPNALADFDRGQTTLEHLSCDILITPHPGVSQLFERMAAGTLVDREACKRYAAAAREQVKQRVARERTP